MQNRAAGYFYSLLTFSGACVNCNFVRLNIDGAVALFHRLPERVLFFFFLSTFS